MKRGRVDEPEEGIDQRLENLIVWIGDKNSAELGTNLHGLAGSLLDHLGTHRDLIHDKIFDCVRTLHPKSSVYGGLAGLLNAQAADFGADLVAGTHAELQRALDDHSPHFIRGLVRFAAELSNNSVIPPSSAVELIEALLAVRSEPSVLPARAEWFAMLAIDALMICGGSLAASAPAKLAALLSSAREFVASRAKPRDAASLLLPFGDATREAEVVEHVDALWGVLSACSANFGAENADGWSPPPCVHTPWASFTDELRNARQTPLRPIAIPEHSTGCTYPMLRRLRILGASGIESAENDPMDENLGENLGDIPPSAERTMMEEHCWCTTHAFAESHKDCAKLLNAMQESFGVDGAVAYVETILSLLLLCPPPRQPPVYYACLLLNLSKLLTPVPPLIERSVNALFGSLRRLDAELASRLAEWLSLHLSHFDFNMTPFASTWSAHLGPDSAGKFADKFAEGGGEGWCAHGAFVHHLLTKMIRLAYHERVTRGLPEQLAPFAPPKPEGTLAWASVSADDTSPESMASESAELMRRLRAKVAPRPCVSAVHLSAIDLLPLISAISLAQESKESVLEWLETTRASRHQPAEHDKGGGLTALIVHSLLDAGAKSVSHFERLLEKFEWLFRRAASAGGKVGVAHAVGAYWAKSSQMAWIVCMKLVRASVIDPAAVVAWATRGAALGRADTWEGIEAAVCHVEEAQRDAADAMRAEEERHLASRGDDPNEPASAAADARLSAKVDALDRARREKKGLFANLFVGACTSLSEHRARGGDEAWYRAAIGLLLGCARRHVGEISVDAVEMVVEGSDVDQKVAEDVFGPLRKLQAFIL